jgi:glucose uptake protein
MFFVQSYGLAILFCIITMLCWGSWANMQKATTGSWPFQYFYWDYAIGVLIITFISAITLGNHGSIGRGFLSDLSQANFSMLLLAFIGGSVFNLANILLVAAIDIAGMAVAFPVAIGLALVLGVILNYIASPVGSMLLLSTGVFCVIIAIILDAKAYKTLQAHLTGKAVKFGLMIALISGVLMGTFYYFVAASMVTNFSHPEQGKLTPYSAGLVFSVGLFISNFIINTWMMKKPLTGSPLKINDYFNGCFINHFYGVIAGIIWGIGIVLNFIAAGTAGPAISYGLGQGATMVAALWGVMVWKEFKQAPVHANYLLKSMFIFYVIGLLFIILAKF